MASSPESEHEGEPPVFRRVFVVGCQRSGTTVVQSALARASGLYTLPETHYFLDLLGGIEEWVRGDEAAFRRKVRSRLRLVRARTHREMRRDLDFILSQPELGLHLRHHWSGAGYARAFALVMDHAARSSGARGWIEKSPDHLAYLDDIRRFVPEARFIHVLRNGEDVIASVIDAETRYADAGIFRGGIAYWIERWNRATATSLRYAGDPDHLVLLFEDFLARPQTAMRTACDFLGLPAAIPPKDWDSRHIADVQRQPWKSAALDGRARPPRRKFEQLFGPELRRRIAEQLADYAAIAAEIRRRQQSLAAAAALCA
jgi:hypothetical protein